MAAGAAGNPGANVTPNAGMVSALVTEIAAVRRLPALARIAPQAASAKTAADTAIALASLASEVCER